MPDDTLRSLVSAEIKDKARGGKDYKAEVFLDKRGGLRLRLTSSTGGLAEVAFNVPEEQEAD